MSGEDIREELRKRKGSKPSAGTVYPVLKVLKKNGFIEEIEESGKMKKYKITKSGEREVNIATKKFIETFCDMKEEFKHLCK